MARPAAHGFQDRTEAGRILAEALNEYADRPDVSVLALPRGGVPVAAEIARLLSLPMDLWMVRKLGAPGHEELAIGAITPGGILVRNESILRNLHLDSADIARIALREGKELDRRNHAYRGDRPPPDVAGRTVILVDDGFATGATMKAAIAALRQSGAARVVAAAPVGSAAACLGLAALADDVVCPFQPEPFFGVGQWYESFPQLADEDVIALLDPPPQGAEETGKGETRVRQ